MLPRCAGAHISADIRIAQRPSEACFRNTVFGIGSTFRLHSVVRRRVHSLKRYFFGRRNNLRLCSIILFLCFAEILWIVSHLAELQENLSFVTIIK